MGVASKASASGRVLEATPSAEPCVPLPGCPLSRERGEGVPRIVQGTTLMDSRPEVLATAFVAVLLLAIAIGGLIALLSLLAGAITAVGVERVRE